MEIQQGRDDVGQRDGGNEGETMSVFYRPNIEVAASLHGLSPDLIEAVVMQESNGWASAFRYEPEFWTRYLANNPVYKDRHPHEVSSSYGLMQVMYPTAVDHGFTGQPWELFAPDVSLAYGCRVLKALLQWSKGLYTGLGSDEQRIVTRSALAAYNGGKAGNRPTGPLRNKTYADEVYVRYDKIRAQR